MKKQIHDILKDGVITDPKPGMEITNRGEYRKITRTYRDKVYYVDNTYEEYCISRKEFIDWCVSERM